MNNRAELRRNLRFFSLVALLGISALLLSACGSNPSAITTLDSKAFSEKIKDPSIVILDVRTPGEFMTGHIANAMNIDVESSTFESEISKLDKSKSYAVYCHSGRRSGIATTTMAKVGFTHLYNLDHGLAG